MIGQPDMNKLPGMGLGMLCGEGFDRSLGDALEAARAAVRRVSRRAARRLNYARQGPPLMVGYQVGCGAIGNELLDPLLNLGWDLPDAVGCMALYGMAHDQLSESGELPEASVLPLMPLLTTLQLWWAAWTQRATGPDPGSGFFDQVFQHDLNFDQVQQVGPLLFLRLGDNAVNIVASFLSDPRVRDVLGG